MRFSSCLICKLPGFREHRLCRHCALELRDLQRPVVRRWGELTARSLFSWRPGDKYAYGDLVYALKGMDQPDAWFELAVWMVDQFVRAGFAIHKGSWIVPIPGRPPNHALGLARAVARVIGGQVNDCLVSVVNHSQKGLSRDERGRIQFRPRGDFCSDYRSVLIVDDVITTGATAEAAFVALNRPEICEVWCLMDRRPCGT